AMRASSSSSSPTGCTTCAHSIRCLRRSANASRWRRVSCMRRWRTASAWRASRRSSKTWPSSISSRRTTSSWRGRSKRGASNTTVFGPGGQLYEIQIRTRDMHRTAEYGIAAHWLYKENGKSADELDHHLSWFRQLIELQQDAHSPEEFLEFLKIDLYQDEIFVFTPRGDVKRLPKGATPIDFAFLVH